MAQVLDYSLARPNPQLVKAKGYVGVMRYLAPAVDAAKVIYKPEYEDLLSAGLQVGLNWEWYGNRAREGLLAGHDDAWGALAQATTLGYTGAIYFSVDYDAPESDQAAINAYFVGAARVLGLARLGCYAGYWPLSRLFDAGLITYGWQSNAWSGSNREARAALLQTLQQDLAGTADINEVLKPNWTGEVYVDYKAQQAQATWAITTYPANTGIHAAWLAAYQKSIVSGPPICAEFTTVDWAGAPIQCQYFGSGVRIEYYTTGVNHGYTATATLW